MDDTIGIDISKDNLDIHRLSDGQHVRFSNDIAGLKALTKWVGKAAVRAVYEATGRYHRDLEVTLTAAGHGLIKVNPARARRFAQAIGQQAKTDKADAEILARMGSVLGLEIKAARTEDMQEIKELHVSRVALVKDRTACLNRIQVARNKLIIGQLRARHSQIERQISQIDSELRRRIADHPALSRRYNSDLYSRDRCDRGDGADHRDAGARDNEWQGSRQSGWPRANCEAVRQVERPVENWRWKGSFANDAIHASAGRDPLQQGPGSILQGTAELWKTDEGRTYGRHAKASPAGQCTDPG